MLLANLQHFCNNNNIIILNYYYFIPGLFPSILGGQKAAVLDSVEGWCAASNLEASKVSIHMDDRMDGQRDECIDNTYYKITITNYISNTSLYTTFHMYPSGPWPLKILMFALLVTREIATYC